MDRSSGASLVRLLEAVLASPHDAVHVVKARAAHMRRCKLQARLSMYAFTLCMYVRAHSLT